jgi:integral membrane protein
MTIRNFRYLAVLEALSFLILLFFSVINRNESLIGILGPIHGVLFMGYVAMVWLLYEKSGWSPKQTAFIVLGAVVPFGGFVVDWWLAKRYAPPVVQLEG